MAVICDTGGIYALYDADDRHHQTVRSFFDTEEGPFVVPAAILAEVDYLLTARLGVQASLDFIESIETGAFWVEPLTIVDVTRCRELMQQYRSLPLGLADSSVIAAAERLLVPRILTLDQRHFRTVRPHGLDHFEILPADWSGKPK